MIQTLHDSNFDRHTIFVCAPNTEHNLSGKEICKIGLKTLFSFRLSGQQLVMVASCYRPYTRNVNLINYCKSKDHLLILEYTLSSNLTVLHKGNKQTFYNIIRKDGIFPAIFKTVLT